MGELECLEHGLVVLLFVAQDQLEDNPVAGSPFRHHLQRAVAHLGQVLARLGRAQERQIAAAGPGCLEGVIDVGQVLMEQRPAAIAVDQPQVLEGGDVPEVPDQRAHQRRVNEFEVLLGHRLHQRQRARACLGERLNGLRLGQFERCLARAVHYRQWCQRRRFGKPQFGAE